MRDHDGSKGKTLHADIPHSARLPLPLACSSDEKNGSASTLASLLRTAAAEAPWLKWVLSTYSPLTPSQPIQSTYQAPRWTFTDLSSGANAASAAAAAAAAPLQCLERSSVAGVQLSPVLLEHSGEVQGAHCGASTSASPTSTQAGWMEETSWLPQGHTIITGGTGALGSLVACWQAGAAPHAALMLAGTSGRFNGHSRAADVLCGGPAAVTVRASDLASFEGSAALQAAMRRGSPMGLLAHASGALQDDLIPNQTPRWAETRVQVLQHPGLNCMAFRIKI